MKKVDNFDGYIILLCKNHYKTNDFLMALKRLWAVRCGYDFSVFDVNVLEYIANQMYRIVRDLDKRHVDDIVYDLHRQTTNPDFQYRDLEPIERIVMYYRNQIMMIQIKETSNNSRTRTLVKLPKPRKRILNKLFSENPNEGELNYYNLLAQ